MAIKKYLKFDSELGYLEDRDDINYFASNQMRKIAFGKMLGDFDENGLYVIKEKIVEELIRMPKVIVEMVEDADLIRSVVKADAFFHFMITVEDNKATFKLLEKLQYQSNRDFNAGAYSNINEYVLDEVEVPDKDFDRNALYQKYNISTENNGEVLSIFDMDELSIALYYNIVEKLKTNYLVQNELMLKEKELESIEADYFESMLAVLAEFGDFNAKVVEGVQNNLAEKHSFVIISKPFFQHAINEVLDDYIEQYMHELSPEQKEQFMLKMREVKAKYYEAFKKLLPIEISQKSGVRFDGTQVIEENIIGGLAKEIVTKGYTSSDVRRIIIKDDELQLSINKIKEIVKENEEICKRDNAKAKDITTGRKLTTEFYKTLEAKNKVDMLSPDTSLIGHAIEENKTSIKQENGNLKSAIKPVLGGNAKKATNVKTGGGKTVKAAPKKETAKSSVKTGKASSGKKDEKKKSKDEVKASEQKYVYSAIPYGSGTKKEEIKSQDDKSEVKRSSRLRLGRSELNMEEERNLASNHTPQGRRVVNVGDGNTLKNSPDRSQGVGL